MSVGEGASSARSTPLVSVVIPAYNAAAFIAEALDSVLGQSYGDFEVIVVNDGSPDTPALEEALIPYGDRIRYLRQENQGPSGARNTGIRAASGEYVALLDSDDYWDPDFLAEQVRLLTSDPAPDMVYADLRLVGDTPLAGRTFMQTTPSRGQVTFESLVRLECVVITSGVVARRNVLIEAGLFDDRYRHSEDFQLWLRVLLTGGKIAYQTKVLGSHRAHAGSLTAESGALLRSQIEICGNLIREMDLSEPRRRLLERHRAWCRAQLALRDAKRELATRQYRSAASSLAAANRVLRSPKITASLVALRLAPPLLRKLYLQRESSVEAAMRSVQRPEAAIEGAEATPRPARAPGRAGQG